MMRLLICISLIFLTIGSITAQEFSKGDSKKYKEAIVLRKSENYSKALKLLDKLIEKYPENQDLLTEKGVLYISQDDKASAADFFKAAWDLDPKSSHRLTYTIAALYKDLDKFEESLEMLQKFYAFDKISPAKKASAKKLEAQIYFTQDAKANPLDIELERLSANINSGDSEYLPSFSADGQNLIFTVRKNGQEDLYQSQLIDNEFVPSLAIQELNTDKNEGAHCLSPDGQYLFLTICHLPKSQGGCDLYISIKKEEVWMEPINMGVTINSRSWDAQPSLSPDGKRLYFTSDRKGGFGKSDIWYSEFINGKWSPAINAGPAINTTENEASPFIHLDGETLYFRSDGHVGMGDYDLFLSRKEHGEWTEAKNLGYPINTVKSEGALSVSTDGKYAFYASDAESNNLDIYRFELPKELKPKPVTFFKASCYDAQSQEPVVSMIEIYDVEKNELYLSSISDEKGSLLATIPKDGNFSIHVSSPGYIFYSDKINWSDTSSVQKSTEVKILLEKIIQEEVTVQQEAPPVILKNIFFESGSNILLPSSENELSKLAGILKKTPESNIKILGHTDDVGSEDDNLSLSQARADAVKVALTQKGIPEERISTQGLGESQPIDTNETEIGRSRNRRTEFVLFRGI